MKASDFKITNNSTHATVVVKAVQPKKNTADTYTLETYTGMTDAKEYTLEFAGASTTFTVTDGTVAYVGLSTQEIAAGTATEVKMTTLDKDNGADVVKLAVMPQNMWDVLHLLEETNRFHENHPDHPLITMSMGAKGGISRVSGEFFGSCVTFGAGGQASAPGQLPVKQLEEILHILHQSVD